MTILSTLFRCSYVHVLQSLHFCVLTWQSSGLCFGHIENYPAL